GNSAIDAAGQAANDVAIPYLLADFLDLGFLELCHGPVTGTPTDVTHEIGDKAATIGRVHNFRMELHAVEALFIICDNRKRCAFGRCDDAEAGGKFCYLVAVAHPHLMLFADFPQAVEQDAAFRNLDKRAAKFTAL